MFSGTLPRPIVRAEPGSVIALGRPGALWCQGTLEAQECRLYKEGIPEPWDRAMPLEPGNKAKFPTLSWLRCTRGATAVSASALLAAQSPVPPWSWGDSEEATPEQELGGPEPSSPSHPQPGSPAAPAPQDLTLENLIHMSVAGLVLLGLGLLLEEAWTAHSSVALSLHRSPGPATRGEGQYWCVYRTRLGPCQPSDPLTLVVTGMFPAPSLSAQPSPVVVSGGNVSLSCRSEYDDARTVHPWKEGGAGPLHSLEARFSHGAGVWQATFLLGPVDSTQGGIYRCYRTHSSQPHVWSLPSEPLELQVTGEGPGAHGAWVGRELQERMYRNPSLQAQPEPSVPWGVTVALRCGSEEAMDTFLLHKVGSGTPPQRLHVLGSAMAAEATFMLGPVTSAHGSTYRCYGAHSTDPSLWSWPSDPLQLEV
ncbi:leukocyte immunoglobulin-like receptor subfamily A member 6 [Oryctolagus cuniculus]|uniref:leukocyte immunoglobulin-like receptor subfamily A member 6 n=1 Tax=Oryctolagus cuniculus TaxID=9986 RepID=UPI00387A2E83